MVLMPQMKPLMWSMVFFIMLLTVFYTTSSVEKMNYKMKKINNHKKKMNSMMW